jgi:hypothetical protein
MTALCEWASGEFTDLSAPACQSAMHFDNISSRITTKLVENRFRSSESWQKLQVIVGQDVVNF